MKHFDWTIISLLAVAAVGCGTPTEERRNAMRPSSGDTAIPQLGAGHHTSLIVGFETYPTAVALEVDARWQRAVAAGMNVGRVQLDWRDLEPEAGAYELTPLREALAALRADGLSPLIGVYAIDSEGTVLPPDLDRAVAAGERMDSERILDRHGALLDRIIPIAHEYDAWGILLTNEPDAWVDDNGRASDELAGFYRAATERVHAASETLAVSATHTFGVVATPERFHQPAVRVLDFASYNYYPLDPSLRVVEKTRDELATDLDALLAVSDGKEMVLQELGAPAGYADSSPMGATTAYQTRFFRDVFDVIVERPRIRASFVFQLIDWSDELTRLISIVLIEENLPQDFVDRFEEWFATIGLLDLEGQPRPAWQVFLNQVESEVRP